MSFFQSSFGAIFLASFEVCSGRVFFPADTSYFWLVAYTAIFGASIGWTIWFILLRKEDAMVVSGTSFIVPLVALFSGWLFLKENIVFESITGSALVLSGVFLVNKSNKHNKQRILTEKI